MSKTSPRQRLIPIHIDHWIYTVIDPESGKSIQVKYLSDYPTYAAAEDGRIWVERILVDSKRNSKRKQRNKRIGRRFMTGWLNTSGAPQVSVRAGKGEKGVNLLVCRVIAEAWVPGKTEEKCFIDHLDNNRTNNHPSNMEWVTHKENMRRMWEFYLKVPKFRKHLVESGHRLGEQYMKALTPKQRSARSAKAWVTRKANKLRKAA